MKSFGKIKRALALALTLSAATICSVATAQADEIEALKKKFANHHQKGQFKQILQTGHMIEAKIKAKHGEGHNRHILFLDRLANQYKIIGLKKNAEGLLLKALKLSEAKKDTKAALVVHSSLGILYVGQNRKKEAETQFKTASSLSEKIHGADSEETKILKNNLALLGK